MRIMQNSNIYDFSWEKNSHQPPVSSYTTASITAHIQADEKHWYKFQVVVN